MRDQVLDAMLEYERNVAPAYELIRRSRARLAEQLGLAVAEPIPALGAFSRSADPTEPNGAEYAVEAALATPHPEQGLLAGGAPAAPDAPAPETQPGQVTGSSVSKPASASKPSTSEGVPGSSSSAALVACPACGTEVKPQGLGSHQRKHKAGYTPPQRESRKLATDADGKVQCPDCPARMVPAGIGPHRHARHGVTGGRHAAKADQPKPAAAAAAAGSWLCGRCPERFSTEELRQAHYDATGHGSPEPMRAPVGGIRRRPVDAALHPGAGVRPSGTNGPGGLGQ